MIKTKYKKILGIVICVIYIFYSVVPFVEIKIEASTALDTYAPGVSIGQPLPSGFSILDISNFLSHVLDSATGGIKKNLGYIWNRIVDSGYCPGNLNTHRHSFIYGLTSTSLTNDLQQPREGYYCYCEHCGQMAGNLIQEYINESNIDSEGNMIVYPSICGMGWKGSAQESSIQYNEFYPYGENFNSNYGLISQSVSYGNGYIDRYVSIERGICYLGIGFDIENINYIDYEMYWNMSNNSYTTSKGSYSLDYDPPWKYQFPVQEIGNKWVIGFDAFPQSDFTLKWISYRYSYIGNYFGYMSLHLQQESLNDNYNYDNIQAPIAYVNNGTLIYGGYSSSIVDTDTMIYTDPSNGVEYEIDSMEYDYSTNTYTLEIADFLNGVTVEFGVDGIKINENGQDKQYFYITNPLTPVNPVTNVGTGTGLVNLDGTINLTVNQVSSNTNAYITTNEDIPQGLRALRETLATMFVELPEMTGEVTDFMQEGFSYIPQEVTTLIIFGVSVAVFVGIFKLFWR